ncbi:methylthioadenosine phosphorylase [Candidatus Falkowbacteria bacterium RIFOXYA2_FULL_35_8]|uniref:Purine nucleoside phosphorylase n=1 Tax=Candidatus Falkowbacteria bacterium RIFOXYC2_FULL_36_12 TaxID=1798002 RepID=A0A1F5T1M9_9BACT|nr:MAG: methylthioadenosine phosphorylase [Candidatus Falkowbacteria bacterium RIFOXYB2_FULL_35_7]OGF32371.1 MAG: methylthioadenosine phosphorylase [Candidatus Falkowbacteria bacterium RIFOXYC2_FULL_36_12]OGF33886.1 MAG: methylthioadenosine phosphorylase [Candidatus Falkowbacteria bacterium RIFOXYA2_FULL_35_8]
MKLGIIGGSGLDDPMILENFVEKEVETPFGRPSSVLTTGKIGKNEVVIISRHNKDHSIMPTNVPNQANIWSLKQEGCEVILATTACGSLREQIKPGDFVFVDQFIDWTKHRNLTFFTDKVIHTPMAEPFDKDWRKRLVDQAAKMGLRYHDRGTVITIEGPRFSTKAESKLFQQFGADVINMSTSPEAILANEIGLPYQTIAMSTDYDCWKEGEEPVTWDLIVERMNGNSANVIKLLIQTIINI